MCNFGGAARSLAELERLRCGPRLGEEFLAYRVQPLGVDRIEIYRPARLDHAVSIEETVGAMSDMIEAGYVRYVGLPEVGAGTLRRVRTPLTPICALRGVYALAHGLDLRLRLRRRDPR